MTCEACAVVALSAAEDAVGVNVKDAAPAAADAVSFACSAITPAAKALQGAGPLAGAPGRRVSAQEDEGDSQHAGGTTVALCRAMNWASRQVPPAHVID